MFNQKPTNMFKLLGKLVSGKNADGDQVGLMSLIKEKTGKISFRRSFPIVILTTVAAHMILAGNTWEGVVVVAIGAATYVLPVLFSRRSDNPTV